MSDGIGEDEQIHSQTGKQMNIEKWEKGKVLSPEEEGEYIADVCEYLRDQQVLSNPKPNENGGLECEVVPDEVAAHVADLLEELWSRVQNLTYELKEERAK